MMADELRNIPLLSDVNAGILKKHLEDGQISVRHYMKGITVHNQNDSCAALDVVLSGSLSAYSLSENGSAITMFEFQENSIIGANLLFGESHAYPLNIYSVSECVLLHITQKGVADLLHNYNFVLQYVKSLSLNSQGMNRKITMLTQKTLRENILDYLKQQSVIQNKSEIILPISKKELADYLGVQRPSLFRELKKLKDEKVIEIHNRSIQVL